MIHHDQNTERFVSKSEARYIAGNVSDMTLWRWERDGKFPQRVRLAHNKVVWRLSDIQNWINRHVDARGEE